MEKYTAIIVEPRRHPALKFVLNNFLENLSEQWLIIIFHGCDNIEYVKNIVNNISTSRIKMINLNVSNLNYIAYNNIFKNIDFYLNIPT